MTDEPAKKRGRGRPPGAKNKKTLAREAAARGEVVPVEGTIVPNSGTEDEIVRELTDGLDDEMRVKFAAILRQKMSLEERAEQLVELARLKDTKRAAVGLRAIQEINAITGVHDPKPQETPPMFVFPEDTQVAIHVEKVIK
jgi:hypothetical protein